MNLEAPKTFVSPENIKKTQPVIRTFPFSLINSEKIIENISNDVLEKGYLPLINIYLAIKSSSSKPSANNLSAIGGKMEKKENPIMAGYREVPEEVTLTPIPCSSEEIGFKLSHVSFDYKIKRKKGDQKRDLREVHFMVLPIMDPEIFTTIYTNQKTKSKIDKIIPLEFYDLAMAIDEGHYKGRPLEGHITTKKSTDIVIDNLNTRKKNLLLRATLNILSQYENELKNELLDKVIMAAKRKDFNFQKTTEKFEDQLLKIKKILPKEIFISIFNEAHLRLNEEKALRYFRKKQIEIIKEQKDDKIKISELKNKELRRLKINTEVVKKSLVDWTFGIEYLHYLQLYVKNKTHEKSLTTGSIVAFGRLFNGLLNNSIDKVDFLKKRGRNKKQTNVKNILANPEIHLEEKQKLLKEINNNLIQSLTELFDVDPEKINEAWAEALRFIPNLAGQINKIDPAFNQISQYDELRNEVSNASLAKILLLLQSVDVQDHKDNWPILKFEAGRQLVFFLKVLLDKPFYQKEVSKTSNPLNEAINTFFGETDHIHELKFNLKIRNKNHKFYMQTYDRKSITGDIVRVDKKPLKPFVSFLRKSFETKVDDIKDFYSVNIVLPDEDYKNMPSKLRIRHISELFGEFKTFIRNEFPQYQLEEVEKDKKNTFGNYFRYQNGEEIMSEGSRTGSQASRIIRSKTYLKLSNSKNPDDNYYVEISLYPFESLYDPKRSENDQIMGWRENITDHQRYEVRRMLQPLIQGGQSLLELLFPPFLYPNYIRKIKELVLIPD